jgi:hypothetical protein
MTKYQINLARALANLGEIGLFLLHHHENRRLSINAKQIIVNEYRKNLMGTQNKEVGFRNYSFQPHV